ncbi:MAG TPA: hypothetical protein VIM11_21225 [Tepidisphaeraceae bacterium]|jgi:hypothetical protein
MQTVTQDISTPRAIANADPEPPFGVNEMRLNGREWIAVIVIVVICALVLPRAWKRFEVFQPGPDYRIPYALSKDYWLYERRLDLAARPDRVMVVGDSVVWGEYVRPDGTLTHFLNQHAAQSDRFVNCGVNGLFPLALEGLLADYASALHGQKILLHCNMLWITSPKADLSIEREQIFNHSRLVPQFTVPIPCYRADANERLSAVLERNIGMFSWVNHLQIAYYNQQSIPNWTLEDDGRDAPAYPNTWRSPLSPLRAEIPAEPTNDPARGPLSPRHKPWTASGSDPTEFEWVNLDASLQWKAFERLVARLRDRGNDVLVVIGPFNEHMIAENQRPQYHQLRNEIAVRLDREHISWIIPDPLPTQLYADASHPLTAGYAALSAEIYQNPTFKKWMAGRESAKAIPN